MSNFYNDYLIHHGVKGMKWGVRRYQNADGSLTPAGRRRQRQEIKQDERRLYKESYDRFTKEYDLEGKRKAAFDYGKQHNLDLDDGGGGSAKAGSKYVSMWDEIERLDSKAMERAESYTQKQLAKKYGDQTMKDLKDREYKIGVAKVVVASSIAILTPVSIVVGLIATDPNVRKSK